METSHLRQNCEVPSTPRPPAPSESQNGSVDVLLESQVVAEAGFRSYVPCCNAERDERVVERLFPALESDDLCDAQLN